MNFPHISPTPSDRFNRPRTRDGREGTVQKVYPRQPAGFDQDGQSRSPADW